MSVFREKAIWSLLRSLGYETPEPGVEPQDEKRFENAVIAALTAALALKRARAK